MTLLGLFNKTIKELPEISEGLMRTIRVTDWTEERKEQAILIVRQIKERKNVIDRGYNYINLIHLTIVLLPKDCGLNAPFSPETISEADSYLENLVADINYISSDIKFRFAGHDYNSKSCTFDIVWEF